MDIVTKLQKGLDYLSVINVFLIVVLMSGL